MATIEKRAKGQYRATIRRKGYPVRRATFSTKPDAEAWARDIESDIDAGKPIISQESARTTFREALERYKREVTPGKKGAQFEGYRINRWLKEQIAGRPLISIRGADMAEYRDRRIKDGVSANTVRLELAVVSNLFTVARTEWRMEGLANPIQSIRRPKPGKARKRRLLEGEEALLMQHAPKALQAVMTFAIETGMRRGEIATLTRDQIDRKRKVASLDETKNGDGRGVPLSTRAIEAIDSLPAQLVGPVFGVTADWISHAFIDACKAAGITGLHFHDLRREAISRLFERGLGIEEVRTISGHKTLQMLTVYSKLKAEDLVKKLG